MQRTLMPYADVPLEPTVRQLIEAAGGEETTDGERADHRLFVYTSRGEAGAAARFVEQVRRAVVAGDRVSTGPKSRTEVQLDYANLLRLADNTEVKIADLTRTHQQVQVRLGLVNFTVFQHRYVQEVLEPRLVITV